MDGTNRSSLQLTLTLTLILTVYIVPPSDDDTDSDDGSPPTRRETLSRDSAHLGKADPPHSASTSASSSEEAARRVPSMRGGKNPAQPSESASDPLTHSESAKAAGPKENKKFKTVRRQSSRDSLSKLNL